MPQILHRTVPALITALALSSALPGQQAAHTQISYSSDASDDGHETSILIHRGTETVEQEYGWNRGEAERQYAAQHPGSYILATRDGATRRLDNAKDVADVLALRAPMDALSAQQNALGAQMRPLSAQMKALSGEMRATRDPSEQTRLGAQMSAVGKEMGAIGRQQGAVGRQQGVIGKAVHARVLELVDACTRNNTCPVVAGPSA